MNKRKLGQQLYSLVLIILLFLQSSAQVVGAVTSSSSAVDDSSVIQLLEATQEDTGSRSIDLKLSLNNPTNNSIHKDVSVSFSNNQQLKETSNSNILYANQKVVGKYTYSADKLQLEILGNVSGTATIRLSLTDASSLEGSVNFSMDSQNVVAKLTDTIAETKADKPSTDASSNVAPSVAPKSQAVKTVSESTEGNDISKYLPDDSKGTIITGAKIDYTDKDGNPVAPTQVTKDTNLNFQYTWAIPDDMKDGYQLKDG
ncbi:hypothetical protein FND55_00300, partial [Lactobacillus paracasei subsp. paracasei]|nr:hypothetical protein [Lacticaseibacillus paracasei subsp. paracasei]